jgi:hypothetical protein
MIAELVDGLAFAKTTLAENFMPPFEMCRDENEPGVVVDARGKTVVVVDPDAGIDEAAARKIAIAIALLFNIAGAFKT